MKSGLRIELRHDLALTCIGGLALVATAATIAWMILIAPVVVAACSLVLAAGFFIQEWRARQSRPVALTIGAATHCGAEFAGRNPAAIRQITGTVMPNLALVTLRFADGSASWIAVTPGRAGEDAFRRLCTWLRHEVSSPQAVTHES